MGGYLSKWSNRVFSKIRRGPESLETFMRNNDPCQAEMIKKAMESGSTREGISPRSRASLSTRFKGAAILAIPARDTIKRVEGDRVAATPPRSECWAAQTPQVFRAELLREALAKAEADAYLGTDDAELVERLGVAVRIVEGDSDNLKVTHAEDLVLAEHLLARRRRGGRV